MGASAVILHPLSPMGFRTDKWVSGLIEEYIAILGPWNSRPISVLELGVLYGGSLLWLDRFLAHPMTTITGVDNDLSRLDPEQSSLFSSRVKVVEASQTDGKRLAEVVAAHRGPFDLIVDDASHTADGTYDAFRTLWQWVKPGGYYVIEDWALAYRADRPECKGMDALVTDLVLRAKDMGASATRLIDKGHPLGSLAAYRKA